MSATIQNTIRPTARITPGTLTQALSAGWDVLVGYFVRRAAIATLRELDDRALQDMGIARSQIEAAVRGLVTSFDREEMS
jgi:uncharacterized protein YjiS (DUF1127 family)